MTDKESLETVSLDERLKMLNDRLAEHYVSPSQPWILDLVISDAMISSRRFVLGRSIEMIVLPNQSAADFDATQRLAVPPANTTMTLSAAVLEKILADPTRFDPRNAASLAQGSLQIEGDALVAAYWIQLLKRPTAKQLASLVKARARAPAWLNSVPHISAKHTSSEHLFEEIVKALEHSTPLHLSNALDWPELMWTLNDWRVREGATIVSIHPVNDARLSISNFIDAFDRPSNGDAGALYTDGCVLSPPWEERFRIPVVPAAAFSGAQLWFGQRRTHAVATRLHCDLANSFLAQVFGRKRVRLYAPAQEHALYAWDAFNFFRPCSVDVVAPNLDRFPRFTDAQGIDVVLAPGDLLIIPTGWFHCVWALDNVLSISRVMSDEAAEHLKLFCPSVEMS